MRIEKEHAAKNEDNRRLGWHPRETASSVFPGECARGPIRFLLAFFLIFAGELCE
jgi:hypothetical protein